MLENHMGPNAVWLCELLCQRLALRAGMRVLDLGCGKAMTSIFLAKEFGVDVTANDWWISATDNWKRVNDAGVAGRVMPLRAEAHALPYADGYFDAIVSVDAYQYFGTDDLFLPTLLRLLRPEGQLGIVVPSLRQEQPHLPPDHLKDLWDWDFCAFHSADWWRRHWEKTGLVDVQLAEWLPGGHDLWYLWEDLVVEWGVANGDEAVARYRDLLRADRDGLLGFAALIAQAK
jgi:cyclopropane fatty-acyl-phospholipid synthase-like methyltransferase